MKHKELSPSDLYNRCVLDHLNFNTTDNLTLKDFISYLPQPRAIEAFKVGTGIDLDGYNIFVYGIEGSGRHEFIREYLHKIAEKKETPSDWCYVNNFKDSSKPKCIKLAPGKGKEFEKDIENFIEEAKNSLKAAFESEEYQNQSQAIQEEIKELQQKAFQQLDELARQNGLAILRTPTGIIFAPVRENGELIPPEEYHRLPEEERKEIEEKIQNIQKEAQKIFQKMPQWQKEMREKLKQLDREVAQYTISSLMESLKSKYSDLKDVLKFLEEMEEDIINNVPFILQPELPPPPPMPHPSPLTYMDKRMDLSFLRRYKVNLLIDNSELKGAPVVYEDNPTLSNLVGRVEHISIMGALITDFNLIKPGALHKANGGYLILDAHKLLINPGAWDGLKRALRSKKIKIESLAEMFSLITTIALEPEPIPLNIKVILVGNPLIYFILREFDLEFEKLFKIAADFDPIVDRKKDSEIFYCLYIASMVKKEGLLPFDKKAIERLIEYGSRIAEDKERLSSQIEKISSVAKEANFWAKERNGDVVLREDVQKAIDSWIFRSNRIKERIFEEIKRDTILIDTEGKKVGQINGLSVIRLGDYEFGRPSRITARVRMGRGEVIDIEREVKLSGPIHSKGVLILAGFLGARYSYDQPLSLSATLVFEQSYSGIEGDSASSAELFALLSAISNIPIKQSIAVTGSINQHGEIQAIGGVNEKIEGFFDLCKDRGLTGEHGVIIPKANVKHLMLKDEVIEAVEKGLFHIYPISHVDEGMEILTDMEAGVPDENNVFPENTINGIVQRRLKELAEKRLKLSEQGEKGDGKK